MKNKLTPDQFFKLFGQLMFGLEDQYTALVKSRAGMPFIELKRGMRLLGFPTAAKAETAAREIFADLTASQDLLEACKLTLEVWDSNSASVDPDEIRDMLTAAIFRAELAEGRDRALIETCELVLIYLEDGAIRTAKDRLRAEIENYSAKETTPDVN